MNITLFPKYYVLVLATVLAIAPSAVSQNNSSKLLGTITGIVTDEESGKPIVGAAVTVAGSQYGTYTDPHGNYQFSIPRGYAKLIFSMIGYVGKVIDSVNVVHRHPVRIDCKLSNRTPDSLFWQTKAKTDIGAGDVHFMSWGLALPCDKSLFDSINSKYGFKYIDQGGPVNILEGRVYNQVVEAYLDSVNGRGWRERYNQELHRAGQKGR